MIGTNGETSAVRAEETKPTRNKLVLAILCVLVVAAIIVTLLLVLPNLTKSGRQISLIELMGTAQVERADRTLDGVTNMSLQSGDVLSVGENSHARVKLDEDKYLYLGASSRVHFTAEGTAESSQTTVYVEKGSVMTEVKHKLSETSTFHVVTANTVMAIRGTKTLTEVIEDMVTGHVQTCNAVLEGQVKIKAVKVKADGTVVSVERDLGAGEGNAFKSSKEELVSREEMQAIAETGASVSGIKVEIVSEEEAGVEFDVATFDATFLESVKSILIADAEAAAGEELADEELDAINAQVDEAMKSLDVIREESQKAIDAATEKENPPTPEPTPEVAPTPNPNDSIARVDYEVSPSLPDDDEGALTVVDGDTNLIDIDDNDDDDYKVDVCQGFGHYLVHHDAKAPTCESYGWEAYDTCMRCSYTTFKRIRALGHDLVHHDAQEPTCEHVGWGAFDTCTRCDYTTYEEIPALGHDIVHHDAQEPTCESVGWGAFDTCTRCDYTTYEEIPALGHDIVHHDAQAPTCESVGWHAYDTCTRCDYTTYEEIPALGHDIVHHDAQAPTCESVGWGAFDTCTRCDYTTYEEIPALGHDIVHHAAQEPTCDSVGWGAFDTCTRCDYTTYEEIPALGHDIVHHAAQEPTCESVGWHAYDSCTRCDYTIYEEIPALGHDFGEWRVAENPYPIYEEEFLVTWHTGTKVRECSRCHKTEEAPLLVTPILMGEPFGVITSLPIDFFSDFDRNPPADDLTLEEFGTECFWVSSPTAPDDPSNREDIGAATVEWEDGSQLVTSLQEGDVLRMVITIPEDKKDVYEDTVISIVITGVHEHVFEDYTDEETGETIYYYCIYCDITLPPEEFMFNS